MSESINLDKPEFNFSMKQKNQQLKDICMKNRRDKEKQKFLRETRMQRIYSYKEEQVVALKN